MAAIEEGLLAVIKGDPVRTEKLLRLEMAAANSDFVSEDRMLSIADKQIERWRPALDKLGSEDWHTFRQLRAGDWTPDEPPPTPGDDHAA